MVTKRWSRGIVRTKFLFWLDLCLLVVVALLQTPRATSLAGHEWLGMAFAALVTVHLLVNWRWIVDTLRRIVTPGSRRTRTNALLNGTLFIFMALTVFSGLAISEVVLPLAGLEPSILRAWRQLHSLFATLSLVIVGLHLALNWNWVTAVVRKHLLVAGSDSAHAAGDLGAAEAGEHNERETDHHGWSFPALMKVIGFQDFVTSSRRLGTLAITVMAIWASCFGLVKLTASQTIRDGVTVTAASPAQHGEQRPRRERLWATPQLTALPLEVGIQLLIIAIATVVGRTLLRLRL